MELPCKASAMTAISVDAVEIGAAICTVKWAVNCAVVCAAAYAVFNATFCADIWTEVCNCTATFAANCALFLPPFLPFNIASPCLTDYFSWKQIALGHLSSK